jgi:GTP-binding protein YchF
MLGIGIVGLPNVGKSTLFNAITNSRSASAENYPFCTIEPNIGIVDLLDNRLDSLSKINNSKKIVRSSVKFVDIAGLVKGASKGEGLGNKFLSNIREVGAICHVVRCFDNESITHVSNSVDPIRDLEIINLELILSDLEIVDRALEKNIKSKSNDLILALKNAKATLESEKFLYELSEKDKNILEPYNLITFKPMFIVANVDDNSLKGNKYSDALEIKAKELRFKVIILSSALEYDISTLEDDEKTLFLSELDLKEPCLNIIVRESYKTLGLISYFTTGPQETRAWTIISGTNAQNAAAKIHKDIERGFIRAEVTSYLDYIDTSGNPKSKGLLRLEGKDYIVQDGDVIYFRFNV